MQIALFAIPAAVLIAVAIVFALGRRRSGPPDPRSNGRAGKGQPG